MLDSTRWNKLVDLGTDWPSSVKQYMDFMQRCVVRSAVRRLPGARLVAGCLGRCQVLALAIGRLQKPVFAVICSSTTTFRRLVVACRPRGQQSQHHRYLIFGRSRIAGTETGLILNQPRKLKAGFEEAWLVQLPTSPTSTGGQTTDTWGYRSQARHLAPHQHCICFRAII
jgi:hypothetical protein